MSKGKQAFGVMPAAMTVWNNDESYNQKETEKYVRWLVDKGAHSISVCGTTGENISMDMQEQKYIMDSIVKYLDRELPIYPGTGRYSTRQTIELSQYAEKIGADGVMVILPYYLKPHKRAAMNHYRELRKNIGIDIMVYNNPWFAGYEFDSREVKTLVDEGVIGSIKVAQGDVDRVHSMKFACGDKLKVFYGHDFDAQDAFFAQADGWLSGLPAVFPKFCRTLYDICTVERDIDKANAYRSKMEPFIDYFIRYSTGDPHWHEIFKYVLKLQGIDAGLPRMPLGDLADSEKKKIDKLMADMSEIL